MKAVILAGGLGTRISEETHLKPKPMVDVGGRPILWHLMKIYAHHGVTDFIVCLGYRGYVVKEFFAQYFLHTSDVTIDLRDNRVEVHRKHAEPWRITLVDTGADTQTGGRLRRVADYLDGEDTFYFTYGDGLADVDIPATLAFHRASGARTTLCAVQPPGRFGALRMEGDRVMRFQEKPEGDGGWINGGFFVVERSALDLIESDATIWEREPLETMARQGQLAAYTHEGFWQPMDTLRDKQRLEELWASGAAPWKLWP